MKTHCQYQSVAFKRHTRVQWLFVLIRVRGYRSCCSRSHSSETPPLLLFKGLSENSGRPLGFLSLSLLPASVQTEGRRRRERREGRAFVVEVSLLNLLHFTPRRSCKTAKCGGIMVTRLVLSGNSFLIPWFVYQIVFFPSFSASSLTYLTFSS